jgi:adenylylsulfate kinase
MSMDHLYPHQSTVDHTLRSRIKANRPLLVWLTGLSGSGKSSIANALEYRLVTEYQAHTYLLDGDTIRTGLNAGLGFSDNDRKENIRRVGEVAKLMVDAGLIVITAFISPFTADRQMVRSLFQPGQFWEVFISCPLEICQQRDPKGLYAKAVKGEIASFTGVSSPYEIPDKPELELKSDQFSIEESVNLLINKMKQEAIILPK